MNARTCYPLILGGCIALLTLGAGAQSTQSNAPAAAPSSDKAAATSAPAKMHHSKGHPAAHGKRAAMASQSDTPYQAALRRCVEGQAQQRDSCLDDAISRYARS